MKCLLHIHRIVFIWLNCVIGVVNCIVGVGYYTIWGVSKLETIKFENDISHWPTECFDESDESKWVNSWILKESHRNCFYGNAGPNFMVYLKTKPLQKCTFHAGNYFSLHTVNPAFLSHGNQSGGPLKQSKMTRRTRFGTCRSQPTNPAIITSKQSRTTH